jgi:hypothetical protein
MLMNRFTGSWPQTELSPNLAKISPDLPYRPQVTGPLSGRKQISSLKTYAGAFFLGLALLAVAPRAGWGQCNWTAGDSTGTCTTLGSVGIGTTSPAFLFDIHAGTNQNLGVRSWAAGQLQIFTADDTYGAYYPLQLDASPLLINTQSGGYVGIGTTTPQQLLDVAGTMAAREIIVTQTGADYVFDPDYRLAPLTEVAGYIQEHHHLPDVPSAEEMQKKGASVGEMQAKLLAKIEELTLHMIQAEEKSRALEQENRELRQEIHEINERIGR